MENEKSPACIFVQTEPCVYRNNRKETHGGNAAKNLRSESLSPSGYYKAKGGYCGHRKNAALLRGRLVLPAHFPFLLAREMIEAAGKRHTAHTEDSVIRDLAEHGCFGIGNHNMDGKVG